MLIEAIVAPSVETFRKLFSNPQALISFRAAVRQAGAMLEKEVESYAPRATGKYLASISLTVHEYDNPYRMVARVYSTDPKADVVEFGAEPHVVPSQQILRWMQAVNFNVKRSEDIEQAAFKVQQKIARDGLKPHHVFTQAFDSVDAIFHSLVDPVLDAIGGEAEYEFRLGSSASFF